MIVTLRAPQFSFGGLCSSLAQPGVSPALENPAVTFSLMGPRSECATLALFRSPTSLSLEDVLRQGENDPVFQTAIEGIPYHEGDAQAQMELVLSVRSWAENKMGKGLRVSDVIAALDDQTFMGDLARYSSLPAAGRMIDVLLSRWPSFKKRFEALSQKADPLEGLNDEEKRKTGDLIRWGVFLWRHENCSSIEPGTLIEVPTSKKTNTDQKRLRLKPSETALIGRVRERFPELKEGADHTESMITTLLAYRQLANPEEISPWRFAKVVAQELLVRPSSYLMGENMVAAQFVIKNWDQVSHYGEELAKLPRGRRGQNRSPRRDYMRSHPIAFLEKFSNSMLSQFSQIAPEIWKRRAEFGLVDPVDPERNSNPL